jgi:dipeptidyl aminopeptidase/acylaminoacyl peptidase
MSLRKTVVIILAILIATLAAPAQQPSLTAADYARAEKFMGYNTTPLVYGMVRATWLPGDKFWYRNTTADSVEFLLVDGTTGQKQPAFDHAKLAAALSKAAGRAFDAKKLPFQAIELSPEMQSVKFTIGPRQWTCDRAGNACSGEERPAGERGTGRQAPGGPPARNDAPSPDGKRTVFIRDWNLWMGDVASGKETQLTTDGVKDYGYATDNAGWTKSDRAIVAWSPDSKKIATFQQDQRKVGEMYLVETKVGHPALQAWKYPLPGDDVVAMIERVIIDAGTGKTVRLKMPPDQHRSTLCDHIICRGGEWADVEWSPDAKTLAFVSTSRDHKKENLRVADAETGTVRDVYEETSPTQFESGQGRVNWHYLPQSNEFLWYTERDGWGHLYLYDLATGKLKNQVTNGDWVVTQVLRVDDKARQIYFTAAGREKGEDPYFEHFYRVGFDGKGLTALTPESGNHEVSLSKSGTLFVDSYSKPDVPPVTVLRDGTGKLVATVEKADIGKLLATGWKPPIPITVKARDGQTDLHGLMFQPTNLDKSKKYPIVNHVYPGPQGGSVGTRSFSAARADCQSLAELGFIVVEIDGMGNPLRSKKFHDFYYANLGDNTLPDQIAGMKQLAQRFPWIDLERAGIYGHSGGGYATADAMFRYPDFFKVGISESGNHDNREYEDDWGERYHGLLVKHANGTTNYDDQANQNLAKNLKGHLLLAHGTVDDNVPPNNTLLVVDALIKANKDFDLLMLPNQRHGYGSMANYMTRRRWDYFTRWLLGAEPPKEYEMKPPAPTNGMGGGPE